MPTAVPDTLLDTRRFLVIDKPAGLAVHPGPRTPHSLEAVLPLLVPSGRPAPSPVHRLDRDTSGCLLLARDRAALRALAPLFAEGRVHKTYLAIIRNPPEADAGTVSAPLSKRNSQAKGWRVVADPDGKPARSDWAILARSNGMALVRFRPATGRTHQLRVHATLLAPGCAIVGDPVYGTIHPLGMMLHSSQLVVPDLWADPQHEKTARAPCPGRFSALSPELAA